MSTLVTHNLDVTIGDQQLVSNLNLTLGSGEVWGLLGGNGAGKTTLLHTLAGLHPYPKGRIDLNGQPLAELSRRQCAQRLGILLQDELISFPVTVGEAALQGRHPHQSPWQVENDQDRAAAYAALEAVDLLTLTKRPLDQLSGGERQRLRIATLLVQSPQIWLLDEPTNHLDLHHQIAMLELIRCQVTARDGCLLMSLHDLNLAARFCDRLILLYPDRSHEWGDRETMLTSERLSRLYRHPIRRIDSEQGPVFVPA